MKLQEFKRFDSNPIKLSRVQPRAVFKISEEKAKEYWDNGEGRCL
jgi:hypothetical protein